MARRKKAHAEDLFKDYPEENPWTTEVPVEKQKGVPPPKFSDVEEYILGKLCRKRNDLREAFEASNHDAREKHRIGQLSARAEEAIRLQADDILFEVMR